jgi:pantoate--beta-alanine ligase
MNVCQKIKPLRDKLGQWRNEKQSVAFVPTMGNLHQGHLSLVNIAQQKASRVVVSIYVNPLQFSPDEDFDSYPRTLDEDLEKLEKLGVDLVFTPTSHIIYPQGEQCSTFVEVPELSDILEGECRPGFFKGVATVVLKLFNLVQPDYAVFGEKDFQQLLVIKQMVKDLNLPVEIIAGEIIRERDGLAMSSRNNYLNSSDRQHSCILSKALQQCRDQIEQGENISQAQEESVNMLEKHGFNVDYVSLRQAATLAEAGREDIKTGAELVILAAARIGGTRLIDNIKFDVAAADR